MAWYKRYRIPFQSRSGTQYMVYIYEQTSGSLVTLTGAAEPFVTQEETDDNIYTPIRAQSGYLRVIDESGGTLLESIMPTNNLQKKVVLYTGTWNSSMTTFTDGTVKWQGFLCAEAFTQPWDGSVNMIEFPVKSMLGALDDIQVSNSFNGGTQRIGYFLASAFEALGYTPKALYLSSQLYDGIASFLNIYIMPQIFFSHEEIQNEGSTTSISVAMSWQNALAEIMKMYGFMMRENGENIHIAYYDGHGNSGTIYTETYNWSYLWSTSPSKSVNPMFSYQLPNCFVFRSDGNTMGYFQGRNGAKVTLKCPHQQTVLTTLPLTEETTDPPISVTVGNGVVKVQPHSPRSNLKETFSFYRYNNNTDTPTSSNYQMCRATSVLDDPPTSFDEMSVTGAFPVRSSFNMTGDGSVYPLENGMFLNMRWFDALVSQSPANAMPCYSIISEYSTFENKSGYLNIQLDLQCFVYNLNDSLVYGAGWNVNSYGMHYYMFVMVQCGNYYWNGEAWVTQASVFRIETDGLGVVSNKTEEMRCEGDEGWFIPKPSNVNGYVTLTVMNFGQFLLTPTNMYYILGSPSLIMKSIQVSLISEIPATASERDTNVYRTSSSAGFSNLAETELSVGTWNNNIDSPNFIVDSQSNYITTLRYDSGIDYMRPELYLINRMFSQYGQMRRTMRADVESGLDIYNRRFYLISSGIQRFFFAVDANHRWRDDEQTVKLIEINNQ